MRRTETEEVLPARTGRFTERPVFASGARHFHGRAGDGAECLASVDENFVVLSRSVAGLACKIRLTPSQYRGVVAVERADRSIVRLIHRDPALTVDLTETADPQSATLERDVLAALLALPAIDHAAFQVRPVKGRRALGHQLRRPRFLRRRRLGAIPAETVAGREIIAPE